MRFFMTVLIMLLPIVASAFLPEFARYHLTGCRALGGPETITLNNGWFGYGPIQPTGNHELEFKLTHHYIGIILPTQTPFTLVELRCHLWGADSSHYEWFIFNASGKQLAKLDEKDFIARYEKVFFARTLWFDNASVKRVRLDNNRLSFLFTAGGEQSVPKWSVLFSYLMTDQGLQEYQLPIRFEYH